MPWFVSHEHIILYPNDLVRETRTTAYAAYDHLETLYETKSLHDEDYYNTLHAKIESLGKRINNFLKIVELKHNTFDSSSVL